MAIAIAFLAEALVAEGAGEWLDTQVDLHVVNHRALLLELARAVLALQELVDSSSRVAHEVNFRVVVG